MSDNFNAAYLATRKGRHQEEINSLLAEDEKWLQAQAPAASPSPAPAAPKKESSPNPVAETLKAVGGGVVDAGRNAINAIDDAATWLDNNFLDLRMQSSTFGQFGGRKAAGVEPHKESLQVPALPEWAQNKSTAGKVGRTVTQFLVPFLGATKALKGVGMANAAVRGATAGAATDFAAFDPHEERLSNLILDWTKGDPAVGRPVFEYLAAQPGDTNAEGRLKNTLEGLGIGMAVEGVFKGLKATREHFRAKGKEPVQVLQEAAAKAPTEDLTAHAVDTSKAPEVGLADQIDLLTGVRSRGPSKFQKRLDVQAAVKADDAAKPLEFSPQGTAQATEDGLSLAPKDALPYSKAEGQAPSFPDEWKLVSEDPTPRKLFLDTEAGEVVVAKEAAHPQQLDLDLALPEALKKSARSPEEDAMVQGYKELQEKVLARMPKEAPTEAASASKGAAEGADLDARIAKAQERVDALLDAGKDTDTAQKVLDNLLKKRDEALRDHSSKLTAKQADGLEKGADSVVDEIAANNERILLAVGGKQQGGFVSPSMLANMASAQAGGLTGYLSAEDDATFAERLSLAGMGALAGLGIKVGASKVLKGHERATIDNPHPDVVSMSRPEVANIAPVSPTAKASPSITGAKVDKLVQAAKEGGIENLIKATKESDFNFDHIDTADDVKATIDAFSSVFEKETSLAKHGEQSFGQMKELAGELGAGEKSLRELYQDTNNLGARILAHRALLTASAEKVTQLSKLAMTGDAEGILSLRKHVALHAAIQAQMKGVQTEVARALGQFRISSTSIDLAANERNQLIDALGGHDANIKFARQLSEITDPKKLNAVLRKSALARTKDALYEAWVNGLLSGPVTHVVNMVGNGLVAVASPAERLVAGMWGKVLKSGPEGVQMVEAKAQMFGMLEGMVDAVKITAHGQKVLKQVGGSILDGDFKGARELLEEGKDEFGNAWRAAATDMPVLDNAAYGTKQYDLQDSAISAGNFNLDPKEFSGKLVDGLGALVRMPGRALTTSDEIFKTLHYRGELKAQAYRTAMAEGLHGDALFERVAKLVEDPTPELSAMALQKAREGTFTAPLGEIGGKAQGLIQAVPTGKWIMPFVRTPTNIMKYVGVRTPGLNLLAESVRADFAAGGARRDMMLARTTMGGALYTTAGYMAAQGHITGGGEKIRSAEMLGGWQPYSVKVGDTYIAYNRMDPLGMFLGLSADIVDLSGHLDASELDELSAMATLAISRNLVSKSYMQGVVNIIDALQSPDQKMDRLIKGYIGSTVPAAVNAVRKEEDPYVREVWTYVDALKNRIPGFSKDLPPKRNVFGEPMSLTGGLGPDIVSPFRTTEVSTDPLATELARLNIDLRMPSKTLATAPGAEGIELSPEQYDKLAEYSGQVFREEFGKVLSKDSYKALAENVGDDNFMDAKEKVIKKLHTKAKLEGTKRLLMEDADLRAQRQSQIKQAKGALTGRPVLPF